MEKLYKVQMNSKGMPDFSTAVEVADKPQVEWISNHDGYWICPECGLRVLLAERKMKGADDE